MRIHHHSSSRSKRITLNLTSMIDVTFLLLIYFIMVTVIVEQEDKLSPMLQTQREEASGGITDYTPQIVEVLVLDERPTYRLGARVMVNKEELTEALRQLPREEGLFVRVADGVSVGFAVAAIQAARDAGFDQVTYVPAK